MAQKPEKQPEDARVERLSGTLERFTFRNPETGFAVARFRPDGGQGAESIVGTLAQLSEGQQVKISGRRGAHPRYGPQIVVETAEAVVPSTTEGITAYLASGLVRGIGPATAKRITEQFGERTLEVIETQPERLREVHGLGEKRIDDLVAAVRQHRDLQDVMVFLRSYGLGQNLAVRIIRHLGVNASALIQSNPYRLADEVIGVGFRTADRLAGSLGIARDAPERLRAGVLHWLGKAARDGHCFAPRDQLCHGVGELLDCDPAAVDGVLPELVAEHRISIEPVPDEPASEACYPKTLHLAECGAASMLRRMSKIEVPLPLDADEVVQWCVTASGMSFAEEQKRAIARALERSVSVITGGPGVGKTTIIRALAEIFDRCQLRLLLAAPTGRAAKRLEQSAGRPACTIHRLLEFQPGIGRFTRDDQNPLEADLLVVDEASMLDIQLAYQLLRAIPPGMRLVLVGDVDQLPAVGPGNVLGDIIGSGLVAVTQLTEIFRQQRESRIVTSAYAVLNGQEPESGGEGSDFFVVDARDGTHARHLVREIVTQRIPRAFHLDPMRDVQVLCPMYRGEAGADAINRDLQSLLNPTGREIERGARKFREGDKVMQVKNDYDLDVFNGDTGRVAYIDPSGGRLAVDFAGRTVEYPFAELDQLVPAYAISVHRSQGSEYPAIVMPVVTEHYLMLRRNLLYTAITRAEKLVVLVGSRRALELAVRSRDESRRHSGLGARLRRDGPR